MEIYNHLRLILQILLLQVYSYIDLGKQHFYTEDTELKWKII